jgi:hypothetical protein
MPSRLSDEIAKLTDYRNSIKDSDIVKELTLVVGYAYLLQSHPEYWNQVRQHLLVLSRLACTRGHLDLCEQASKIIEIVRWCESTDAAA